MSGSCVYAGRGMGLRVDKETKRVRRCWPLEHKRKKIAPPSVHRLLSPRCTSAGEPSGKHPLSFLPLTLARNAKLAQRIAVRRPFEMILRCCSSVDIRQRISFLCPPPTAPVVLRPASHDHSLGAAPGR